MKKYIVIKRDLQISPGCVNAGTCICKAPTGKVPGHDRYKIHKMSSNISFAVCNNYMSQHANKCQIYFSSKDFLVFFYLIFRRKCILLCL